MANTIAELSTEVERLAQFSENQGYRLLELQSNLRNLDMRIDQITPSSLNFNVVPTSKMVTAGVIVGAALGGYIAYVEVTRRLKQKQVEQPTES